MDFIEVVAGFGVVAQTVTVEPYLGSGGTKPLYGAAVAVPVVVEQKRRLVRDPQGREVVSESTLYCRISVSCPDGSKVVLPDGQVTKAIVVKRFSAHGQPDLPEHLEINCE